MQGKFYDVTRGDRLLPHRTTHGHPRLQFRCLQEEESSILFALYAHFALSGAKTA